MSTSSDKRATRARPWPRIAAIAGASLLALFAVLLVAATQIDFGFLAPTIEQRAGDALGRELSIRGPLSIRIGRQIRLDAVGIELADLAERNESPMLRIDELSLVVDAASLLKGPPLVRELAVNGLSVLVVSNEDGSSNWQLGSGEESVDDDERTAGAPVDLRQAAVRAGRIELRSPAFEAPLVINLESLRHDAGAGRLLTSVDGDVNGRALSFSADLGPSANVWAEGPVDFHLTGNLGEITFSGDLELDDLRNPATPSVDLKLSGPDIDYLFSVLNLQPVTTGPLDLRMTAARDDAGLDTSLRGEFGEFWIDTAGRIDNLRNPQNFDFRVDASGPDLSHAGALAGLRDLPASPFTLAGNVARTGPAVRFDGLELRVGEIRAGVDGEIESLEPLRGDALEAVMTGPDIAVVSPLLGLSNDLRDSLTGAFALDAKVLEPEAGASRVAVGGSVADVKGELTLTLPRLGDIDGASIYIDLESDTAGLAAALLGSPALSGTRLAVSGTAGFDDSTFELSDMRLAAADAVVVASGSLHPGPPAIRTRLNLDVTVPDLADIGKRFGIATKLPSVGIEGRTLAVIDAGALQLSRLDATVGDATVSGTVSMNIAEPLSMLEADLDVATDDIAALLDGTDYAPMPSLPASAGFTGSLANDRLDLTTLDLSLGQARLTASGVVGRLTRLDDTSLDIEFVAPTLAELSRPGSEPLPDLRATVRGHFEGSPSVVTGSGIEATLGDSVVALDFRYEQADVPFIAIRASSSSLDLGPFLGEESEASENPAAGGRLIPDVDIPVDLLALINADVDIDVETLIGRARNFKDVQLEAVLQDRALRASRLHVSGAGGDLSATVDFLPADGSYDLRAVASGRGLKIASPGESAETAGARPAMDMEVDVSARGTTLYQLLASLDGHVVVDAGEGIIPDSPSLLRDLLLGDFVYQMLDTVNPLSHRRKQVQLGCAAAMLDIEDGVVGGNPAIVAQLPAINILTRGTLDLETEKLDIDFNVQQRRGLGISLSDAINPYTKVTGTLTSPRLSFDEKGALIEGGAAVATGGLTVLAKSIRNRFFSDSEPCDTALAAWREAHAGSENEP